MNKTDPTVTVKRSFGFDLYSVIGEDLLENAVLVMALAEKELPWGQVDLACRMGCRAASRAALTLRTFREFTDSKIIREVKSERGNQPVSLHYLIGLLVHHRSIEIVVDPPIKRIPASQQNLTVDNQTLHRLVEFAVVSDKGKIKVGLKALADALFDEVNVQLNTPEAKDLKEAYHGRSR